MSELWTEGEVTFSQLKDYNKINFFLEKSYKKLRRETIPRPFSKNLKISISLDQSS